MKNSLENAFKNIYKNMHAWSVNLFLKPGVSGLTSVRNQKFIKTTLFPRNSFS